MANAKILNNDNLRKLVNLLISVKTNQEAEEQKCVAVWEANKTYQKGDIVLVINDDNTYSEYYCRATHVSGEAFNDTYYDLIKCVEFEGYSENELLDMLNLSEQELDTLQNILQPDKVSTSSTWDSSKIYMELQEILTKAKDYADNQVGKSVKPSYKTVTNISEMTDGHYIYLLSNGTNYDLYILEEDGTPKQIGTSDIDLSGYVTENMVEADYLKKADATGTYATIETVDDIIGGTIAIGNADKLNGQEGNQYYSLKFAIELAENTDFDTITECGNYVFSGTTALTLVNSPYNDQTGGVVKVERTGFADGWIKQTVISAYGITYERYRVWGSWKTWERLKDGGNADMLDGCHSNKFVQNASTAFITEIAYGDHNKPTEYGLPILPKVSNYFIYFNLHAESGNVNTALAIGDNYTRNVYTYSSNNGEWEKLVKEADIENYLPLTGGVVSGAISFQSIDNGYCGVTKMHNNTTDDGMLLQDTTKEGKIAAIKICANSGKATFHTNSANFNELLHTGNLDEYVGSNKAKTAITFTNNTNWSIATTNLESFYQVKNGWCFLQLVVTCNIVANDDNSTVYTGLPIPTAQIYSTFASSDSSADDCQLTIGIGGQLLLRGGTVGKSYSFSYTYPVAE